MELPQHSLRAYMSGTCLKYTKKFDTRWNLLDAAVAASTVDGFVAEFGIFEGKSIHYLADSFAPQVVHGFDSFEGLQENWTEEHPEGDYAVADPDSLVFSENTVIHKGLVQDTVPTFLTSQKKPAKFLHIDTDTYLPAKAILESCNSAIVPGTVIVFDEYWSYTGWMDHEARAMIEWMARDNRDGMVIGICTYRLALKVTK